MGKKRKENKRLRAQYVDQLSGAPLQFQAKGNNSPPE